MSRRAWGAGSPIRQPPPTGRRQIRDASRLARRLSKQQHREQRQSRRWQQQQQLQIELISVELDGHTNSVATFRPPTTRSGSGGSGSNRCKIKTLARGPDELQRARAEFGWAGGGAPGAGLAATRPSRVAPAAGVMGIGRIPSNCNKPSAKCKMCRPAASSSRPFHHIIGRPREGRRRGIRPGQLAPALVPPAPGPPAADSRGPI